MRFFRWICAQKKIQTTQSVELSSSDGFEVIEDQFFVKLKAIDFYEGHPNQMANQIHDEEKILGKETKYTWEFTPKVEYFYACVYSSTKLQLVKKLDNFSSCSIYVSATNELDGYASIIRIECQKVN